VAYGHICKLHIHTIKVNTMTYKVSYTTYCDHYIEAHESTSNKDCSPLQKEVQHPSYKNAQSTEMNVLIRLYEYLQCILI
jgi:hypothetical protein